MDRSVALVLVSHDGARWLPVVLEGIRAQRVAPQRLIAVDTASRDESVDLLSDAFDEVLRVPATVSFPEAVTVGLERLDERLDPAQSEDRAGPEWVWLLHDDATPHPGALEALLEAAEQHPGVDVLGPKLREWPSLRGLLELGVTISGTGRRETGLEPGEYDQSQHDEVREVLAVNTAGMLVRRRVLDELGGLDPGLPIFGNDLDFGWRGAVAGHRTLVVPQAVVFHAEAAHRGLRRTVLTGRHPHLAQRRAALYTLLVNSPAWSLPFWLVRLTMGTMLRMAGFLLVRSPGEAVDDLAALLSVLVRPGEILAARRRRRDAVAAACDPADPADVRRLLAPRWLPYRHGLDALSDVVAAAGNQAADVAERRRAVAAERDPASFAARRVALEDHSAEAELGGRFEDTGIVARFLTNPVAVALALVVLASLVGAAGALGPVSGGGLSPAPASVGAWWSLWVDSWHELGQGTAVPAPPYLLPLALLASVLGGSPAAAVSAVLVLAVPVGLWGAWRLLRVVGRFVSPAGAPRWILWWGATTYALTPVVSGAWRGGQLGPVVAAALLPWLAHAALGFVDPAPERRWRAAWRCALLLASVGAFTPLGWILAGILTALALGAVLALDRQAFRSRSVWGPPVATLAATLVLLVPWWLPALVHGAGAGLLLDAGTLPGPAPDGLDLLSGRLDGLGAPLWLGLVVAGLAVLSLLPRATRIPVLLCWVVALVAAVSAAVLSTVHLDLLASVSTPGAGFPLAVLRGALVTACALGAQGLWSSRGRGRLRVPVAILGAVATLVPLVGLVWFVVVDDGDLGRETTAPIPAYMVQSSLQGAAHGILVVRGSVEKGLTYTVRRGDGLTLGEDEIQQLSAPDPGFTAQVQDLASRPTSGVVTVLADRGIEYVVLTAPADGDVAASLDATSGLVQASVENRSTRAWQIARPLSERDLSGPGSWWRVVLLVLQAVAIVVVAVLCAPSTNRRRRS